MSGVNWVVCGWFTPDYRPWWDNLRAELDANGAPYDFVEVAKQSGGWESNTMRKPAQVKAAMQRHPDKTIIFLVVDCSVPGGYAGLERLAGTSGDVGFHFRTKWRRSGGHRLGPRSGTMVFKPTESGRAFVDAWIKETGSAPRYTVDQTSLAVAMGRCPNVAITMLDVSYCAIPDDKCAEPIILHDRASKSAPKPNRLARLFNRLAGPILSPAA